MTIHRIAYHCARCGRAGAIPGELRWTLTVPAWPLCRDGCPTPARQSLPDDPGFMVWIDEAQHLPERAAA